MIQTNLSNKVLIFLVVFLYLVGFGVIIPILPLLGKELGGGAFQIGLLMTIYSLMQFVFSPFWGNLSDRLGRRKILVFCMAGEALTYIWFAFARSYEQLFLARMFAGFFGASLSTASAYISDITTEKDRSKGMAIIGAAFGLGFIIGPFLGGILVQVGKHFSSEPLAGSTFASLFVAALCALTFVFSFFFLPESLKVENRRKSKSNFITRFLLFLNKLKSVKLGLLLFTMLCASTAMSLMEATLILFVGEKFLWTAEKVSYGFAYIGVIMTFTQGFLVRRLQPKWGEKRLLFIGLSGLSLGMLAIGGAHSVGFLALSMTILALGNGLLNPSLLSSVSLVSRPDEQGENLGVAQSASSLGRIIGPVIGGLLYQGIHIRAPFFVAFLVGALALGLLFWRKALLPDTLNLQKPV